MDPIRSYDYLERARAILFGRIAELTPEQYAQPIEIGPGAINSTLIHLLLAEWYYLERIEHREVPPYGGDWPYQDEHPLPFDQLRAEWAAQAKRTKAALAAVTDWDAPVRYRITVDSGETQDVTATIGGFATQLVLHEVHHRAQLLHMLRRLGRPADELDVNNLMFDRTPVTP